MKIGEQPMPTSPMAKTATQAFSDVANRKAPAVPIAIAVPTVRRGPSRSSAQPTGNWAAAKVMNQAAPSVPNSAGPILRSAMTGPAMTLRKEL